MGLLSEAKLLRIDNRSDALAELEFALAERGCNLGLIGLLDVLGDARVDLVLVEEESS